MLLLAGGVAAWHRAASQAAARPSDQPLRLPNSLTLTLRSSMALMSSSLMSMLMSRRLFSPPTKLGSGRVCVAACAATDRRLGGGGLGPGAVPAGALVALAVLRCWAGEGKAAAQRPSRRRGCAAAAEAMVACWLATQLCGRVFGIDSSRLQADLPRLCGRASQWRQRAEALGADRLPE